ncbi:MAG: secretin N-terminal domain-containing protein, partial [Phycisphaerae bacterium]
QEYLRKPGGRGRSPELSGDVRLSTMTQSNALVISGDKDEVDRLEGVVRDLDTSTENPNAPRMIRMTHVRASQILPTVEQMFSGGGRSSRRGRRGGGPQAPVLVANEPLNALIVRAGPADFAAIESIVAALDVEEGTVAETVKIVRVQPGPNIDDLASEIEDTVNRGAEATADQFPGMTVPRIVITPNKRTNSLLLAGSPQLFAQAEQLIHAMEEMGPSGGLAIRILDTPPNMSADELRQLIEQLTADDQGGSRARRGTARRGGRSAGRRSSGGRRTGRSSARRPSGRRRRP